MEEFVLLAVLASLLGGGPTDMLDVLSPQDYWKAKGVEVTAAAMEAELAAPATVAPLQPALKSTDPEVVARAQAILANLSKAGRARAVRKLMAIRALGELKDPAALPVLRPLLESKDLFVADYAAAAVAAIEGKPYTRPQATAEERAADLGLLPAGLGAVAQFHVIPGTATLDLGKELERVAGTMNVPKAQIAAKVTAALIKAAESVGNVRVDTATLGVSESDFDQDGYVVVVARGIYDRQAAAEAICKEDGPRVTTRTEGGVQIIQPEPESVLMLPSDRQLVILVGPASDKLPVAVMLEALKTGKGGFAQNTALVKLVQTVDTSQPIWAAVAVGEHYRQVPFLGAFDAVTLTAGVNAKPRTLEFAVRAAGSDKDKAAAVVNEVSGGIQQTIAQVQQMQQRMPGQMGAAAAMQPVLETLRSIKVVADGGNASMTGSVSVDAAEAVGIMPFMMFSAMAPMNGPGPMPAPVQAAPQTAPATAP
jgi:hypothetical protein